MNNQLGMYCWIAGTVLSLVILPTWAEPGNGQQINEEKEANVSRLPEMQRPATTLKEWRAQIEAARVQVTEVQLNPIETGLEIVLQTAQGKPLQVDASKIRSEGNSLIADIPNAVLALTDAQAFNAENPTPDIARVQVVQADGNTIRVTVTGNNALPQQEVTLKTGDFAYSLNRKGDKPDEEIIVTRERPGSAYFAPSATTGTRTDAPLRDIPQSIQVIPRQVIEDQQAIGIEEVLENVGGVTFLGNQDGRGLNFAIRGFNNVPVLRDGFRLFNAGAAEPEVANLERVEVLKGPASVLFGQAEPGGLVNLVSKQPLSEPFYNFQFQVGNRAFISPSIDLSGPLTEDGRLLYRLNALYRREDSFRNYDKSFERFFVGPTLTWRISDRTDLTFSLEYIKDDNPADFGTLALGRGIANIPPERVTNNPEDTMEKEYLNVGYRLEHRFSENWKLRNEFRYIADRYDYSVLALPFSLNASTGILTRGFADQFGRDKIYTLYTNIQGKFNTGLVEHTLLFGVDLARAENENATRFSPEPQFLSFLNIFNPDYSTVPKPTPESIPFAFGSTTTTDRLGVYLQDQIELLDNLIVLVGLRYDVVDRKTTDSLTGEETSQYDDAITPRIGIVYQPIEQISLYASYAQSFTPSFSTDAQGQPLAPEEGEGFEVGLKADIIPNRLSATIAYFDITKQNVATADPANPFASIATGEQRSRGMDFDLIGRILPGWNLIASYAYIDAEVTKANTDIVGNRLTGVPKHSASLWTTYEIQSGNLQGLGFGLGFNFVGERQGDLANSFEADSYFLTNAAIFYRQNRWQVRLNIDNLFNVDYIESVGNSRARGIYPGGPLRAGTPAGFRCSTHCLCRPHCLSSGKLHPPQRANSLFGSVHLTLASQSGTRL